MRTPRSRRSPIASAVAGALLLSLGLAAAPAPAHDGETVPLAVSAEAEAKYAKLAKLLVPSAAAKITKLARASALQIMAGDGSGFESSARQGVVTTWPQLGAPSSADAGAVAFLVMMQAIKGADEDVAAVRANVKAIDDAKAKARANLDKVQAEMAARKTTDCKAIKQSPPVKAGKTPWLAVDLFTVPAVPNVGDPKALSADQLATLCGELKAAHSAISEMSEMDMLLLQRLMERKNQLEQMISNVLKKASETSEAIIQNLK